MKIELKNIIRLLWPKYYNRLTWSIIFGLAGPLISTPIWIDFANILLKKYNYPTINLQLNIIVGLIILVATLFYNSYHRYIEYKQSTPNEPAYKSVHQDLFVDFASMCQTILPILKDNEYIFTHTGLNSSANECAELRLDLSLWDTLKKDSIIPNNAKIRQIISKNIHLVPQSYKHLFNELDLHIQAFEAHVNNPNIDYTEHQFPKAITEVIEETCFQTATNNPIFIKIHKWLSKRVKKSNIEQCCIIGSFLMYPEQAKDVDIVICSSNNFEDLRLLSFDFKLKFKRDLHITYFESQDQDYINFCDRNKYKIEI